MVRVATLGLSILEAFGRQGV